MEFTSFHDDTDVELFMYGGGWQLGSSVCPIFHRKRDIAFKYAFVGASFYGNPKYSTDFITRTIQEAASYSKDPTTSCLCL